MNARDIIFTHARNAKRELEIREPVTIFYRKSPVAVAYSFETYIFIYGDWDRALSELPTHIPFAVLLSSTYHEMYHVYQHVNELEPDEDEASRYGYRKSIRFTRQILGVEITTDDLTRFYDEITDAHLRWYGELSEDLIYYLLLGGVEIFEDKWRGLRMPQTRISLPGVEE